MKLRILVLLLSAFTLLANGQPIIDLQLVTTGFNEPVDIASAGDERLFIVSRHGTIDILYPDLSVSTFLDIDERVGSGGGEFTAKNHHPMRHIHFRRYQRCSDSVRIKP